MKDKINSIIDLIYPNLSFNSRQKIFTLCEELTIDQQSMIVEKDKRDNSEYFLLEGTARSCLMDQDGELVTLLFFESSHVLSPNVTRTSRSLSLINIEAITKCRLVRIDAGKFEHLIEEDLEIREFANTILRIELMRKIHKEIQLTSWTAKQRLDQFRIDHKGLENIVPHTMIASYLGITNVSLSRLRKQA